MRLLKILSRPIAFHRCLAELTGSVTSGLMLSQALYWTPRAKDPDGWFWKTQEEWFEETMLSRKEQETARRRLKELGNGSVWHEQLRGVPAKLFYRIDLDALEALLLASKDATISQASMPESDILECTNGASKIARIGQALITETTTEITSETTTERGEQPRQALVVTQGAPIATPPPPTGGADAASIALEYFPQMGIWQQELIANADINHLTIWRKCVEDWRDNRYSPRNVNGMIDSYFKAESRQAKEQINGKNGHSNRQTAGERKAGEYLALQRKLGENASNDPDYKPLPGFEWLESIR